MLKRHSWVINCFSTFDNITRIILLTTVRLRNHIKAKKRAKIVPKGGAKYKIAYYEAKQDFKVPKIHS